MAGTNILVRQKDLIAGAGISITPDTTSGNVTIAATNTAIDEARLLPTGGKNGNILEYQEGADRGNGNDVRLLLQSALTDSASGNAAPAAVTTQGVTLTGDNSLLFSGNDSHVTAVLATDEIFAADKEWTIDFWMKPIANSSEWNYILTENTGDWGSHSIGLTWNKSKSVLEQDTGGYVASVIKAPNWPNNSIACAVGEWHFVAVEKQKTATGWSLNYYLNGAIWLQVAFTGNFVPFDTTNPFWFGGKNDDTGRWFKGEANKLRVTAGARYGGKAFAVPERLIDYAAPAGQPVWIEGIDRSRLLPENPASGDIPCYNATATIGGGNDSNTVALFHFDAEIKDEAVGNAAPISATKIGTATISTDDKKFGDGSLYFNSGRLLFPVDGSRMDAEPWVASVWFKTSSTSTTFLLNQDDDTYPGWSVITDSNGLHWHVRGSGQGNNHNFPTAEWNWMAVVKDDQKHLHFYLNGAKIDTYTNSIDFTVAKFGLGGMVDTSDGRNMTGYVDEFRLQFLSSDEITQWTGTSIAVPDAPYSKPQTVGEWGKFNKSELVQSVNGVAPNESGNVILDASTIIDNSRLLPVLDALPEGYEGSLLAVQRGDGKVADENTLRLMHFNDDVRDVVTDETGTLKGNASITPTGYFDGALSINHAVVSSLSFNGLTATPTAWTMDFRVKLGRFSGNAPLVLIGTNLNETQTSLIRVDSSYIDIQATYNQRVIYKTHSLQLDTWYHFALTYDGTTYKFYVDGKLFGSGESTNQFDFTRKLWFGSFYDYSTSYVSDCTIDEFRLSNVVRWTENFTPPDAPYGESLYNWGIGPKLDESRLLPETGSVSSDSVGNPVIFKAISRIDNTYWLCLPLNEDTNDRSTYGVATEIYGTVNVVSNAPSSPGGSAFFNGSSCLHGTLPAQFGSGDFTVRFWMMAPGMNSSTFPQTIFSTRYGDQTDASTFALLSTTEGRLFIYSNGDITSRTDTPFTLQPSVWYHVAVVRKSGVLTIYVNGEVYNSATFTNSLTRQIFGLGASWTGSSYSEAGTVYLTSMDVLNYAAYDGAFTTPAYQPGTLAGMGYKVATDSEVTDMLSSAGIDKTRLLPANPSDYDLAIYRVFPEEAAPQNLTSATSDPNWEVTWSGAYSGRVGWWAFDSDQGTMWCTYSAAVGDWLCWEYKGTEGSVLLRRYSIAKGSGNGDCPTGWKIQGSNDGSTWVDLDEQTGQSFPDNNAKEYTIPNNSTPYKFHRFYLLSWNTSNMIGTFKAWSWINSTEERKVWIPINKSEFVVNDARLLPDAPSDTTNSYWLNSGPVTTQVSPASYAGSTDATWTMELSGTFEGGDIATLFDSDTTNGVSGTLGLETFGTVRWIRKDQVPYRIDQIVLRAQTSDIGAFPQTIYLSGYDKSTFSTEIVQEFNAPVWETESNTSTAATSFTRVCTLDVNAPAFQSYDYSITLGSGAGMETTLQAFAAYQLDTETAWKQLNTATTTTAGLMSAADKTKLDGIDTIGSSGDMLKSVYDTNDDGIVDHAATADAVGATTAAQVADAVGKAHTHANKTTLDKFGETNGKPTFDGAEIGGGGTVDESRLLPALDSVPIDRSGNPVVFKAVSEGMDEHTLLYCPFDADMNDHSNAGGQFVQTGQKSESIVTTEKKFGSGCLNCGSGYSFLNGPLAKPVGDVDCTIHFWANITSFTGKSPFTLLTAAIPDDSNATSNFGQAAIGCLQLYVSNDLLLLERRTSPNGHTVRIIEASVSLTTGAWNHFAITRSGNIWYLFLNGQLLGTGSDTNVASATHIRIGGDSSAMSGYVDEFLVLDYAKWITDFEPPTQPATTLTRSYEISDTAPTAVDESRLLPDVSGLTQAEDGKVMQFKFTSAEAGTPFCCNCQTLMPGTTDQLVNDSGTGTTLTLGNTLAVSDAVPGPFGNNCVSGIGNDGDNYTISISPRVAFSAADDFTLEWWLRPPTNALNETFLYFCKENGNYDYSWRIYNGAFWQMSSEIIPASEISSLALKANDWNFLVLCRKSGMFRLFINGIRVFSKSWQWAPPESVTFWKFAGGVSGVSNYCGGFRYSRSALYENDFEVPTAPFSVNAGREMVLDFMREATSSKAGAMSAADKAAIAGLTTHGIYPNARAKSGAVDFNEVIDHGVYFIGGDTPHLNYPETYQQNGGTLQVIRNGNYLTQTFIPLNINTVFIRTCVNALSDSSVRTFSAWRRALTAPDITESKARPGYFKLPGGTIVQWGKKTAITRDEENCYISFPIAFPTMFLSATAIASSGTLSATGVIVSLSEASTTSMTMVVKNHPNTGSPDMDQYIEMYWFAVGF